MLIFVAFVAGATYVAMYRLDNLGLFDREPVAEEVVEVEPEPPGPYPFIIPTNGRDITPATFEFSFLGQDVSLQAEVDPRIYHGAVMAPRGFMLANDASDAQRLAAMQDYYNKLTFDPEMDDAIISVVTQLRAVRDELNLDGDQYAELMTKFVQTIPYDENRGYVDHESKALGDPRMPVQVLVDGLADCDEKVMLLAALLSHEGYATAAFLYEQEQHMALALASEGEGFAGTGYVFIETTGVSYVSEVPTEFIGGISLQSDPVLLIFDPFEAGKTRGTGSFSDAAAAQVARIVSVRNAAEAAADEKRAYIEETPMSDEDFAREEALFNATISAMNTLRATVDNLGYDTGEFKDRAEAINWIDNNAWWE